MGGAYQYPVYFFGGVEMLRMTGSGVIWNPQENKVLLRFTDGEFITDDPVILKKLVELGYFKYEEIEEYLSVEKENEPTPEESPEDPEAPEELPEPDEPEELPELVKKTRQSRGVKK